MKLQFDLNRDDIFKKLLQGELSETEREQAIKAINNDERLKKDFAIYKGIYYYYKDKRKSILKQSLIELEQKSSNNNSKKGLILSIQKIAIIAACLCGVIFLGNLVFNSNHTNKELYSQYFEVYPNVHNPTLRSHQSNTTSIDSQIMNLYEREEYGKSITLYNSYYTGEEQNSIQFYMGISYMKINNLEKAKSIFMAIPKNSKYYEKSKWYLSLCYLNENNIIEFTKIANTLIYKKDIADEIVKSLN